MPRIAPRFKRTAISLATAYAEQSGDEPTFTVPEDLSTLSNDELTALHAEGIEFFDALREGEVTAEALETLSALADGIEVLGAEISSREAAAAERAEAANALAARVLGEDFANGTGNGDGDGEDEDGTPADEDDEDEDGEQKAAAETDSAATEGGEGDSVTASARGGISVSMRALARRSSARASAPEVSGNPQDVSDIMFSSGPGLGIAPGTPVTPQSLAAGLSNRLRSFPEQQYTMASRSGTHMREQHNLATIHKPFSADNTITGSDPEHIAQVLRNVTNEAALPKQSLVASGGWCAPSETVYNLFTELETTSGLLSLPEVNVVRGGLNYSAGPSFASIFSEITGFSFTEAQDVAGEYAPNTTPGGPNVVGDKPCYMIECPDFTETRLSVDGLCLSAGLLQSRGYPEIIARTIRGSLVAHEHRMNGRLIAALVAGSTAVTMPGLQVGTAAPVLTSIELQATHYRYTHRMSENATLEAVFPLWVHGAIRSDLSRRLGVDLLSVTNAQINSWFTQRGIAAQFVYNWQNIDATATGTFTQWPTEVSFLLYAAGTWVRGSNDIITLDTIYDSTMLGQNNYTALFTEEGWAALKAGHDSRMVTVPITADGATAAGVDIAHNGTLEAAPVA